MHCNLVVLIRNPTVRAYVVDVIMNVTSWLSGVHCCHGYKPAGAGRGFEGRAVGRRRELGAVLIQILWLSPLFFSELQTAALILKMLKAGYS